MSAPTITRDLVVAQAVREKFTSHDEGLAGGPTGPLRVE